MESPFSYRTSVLQTSTDKPQVFEVASATLATSLLNLAVAANSFAEEAAVEATSAAAEVPAPPQFSFFGYGPSETVIALSPIIVYTLFSIFREK